MKVISVRGVSYRYEDGTLALDGISFDISKGERVAVLGPNGAGKSTLLEVIMGLRFPQRGTIEVVGETMNEKNAHLLRRHLGLVFQDPDDQIFMPRMWDDVAFGPLNMGLSEDAVRERVVNALRSVGLEQLHDRHPHNLSRGEKRRLAIAGVLAMKPDILLLDEPTGDLDRQGRRDLIEMLGKLENTMLIATHDVEAAVEITGRAVVINRTKLAEASYPELFSDQILLERARLETPAIPRLFQLLQRDGISLGTPSSVAEAAELLRRALLKPTPPEPLREGSEGNAAK